MEKTKILPYSTPTKIFKTTNLSLASVILTKIEEANFLRINVYESVNGKKIIELGYPIEEERALQELVLDFNNRKLVVDLYNYNRTLNFLRDKLFSAINGGFPKRINKERLEGHLR